jgi:hypothetical protein
VQFGRDFVKSMRIGRWSWQISIIRPAQAIANPARLRR